MKIETGKLYAIITGDIVRSSKLSAGERQKLLAVLKGGSAALREAFGPAGTPEVDIYRGDAWQMLVPDPASSLRRGLFYRAFIKSHMGKFRVDTRMAIAVGTLEFVPGDGVSRGHGEAYRLSGRALEAMKPDFRMDFNAPGKAEEKLLDTIVKLVDALAADWSDRQALALTGALQGWTQEKIGRLWEGRAISQQSVSTHLRRAGWYGIEQAIQLFENSF
jgi:hypothetical protein